MVFMDSRNDEFRRPEEYDDYNERITFFYDTVGRANKFINQ